MMLVRELNDEPFHTEGKAYVRFGGATEGRLWCNGRPVGVNYSATLLDVAPVVSWQRGGGEGRGSEARRSWKEEPALT